MPAIALLAACGGAPATVVPTAATAPAPTARSPPTTAPAATTAPNGSPLPDTNPAKPDDKTQGRLRISNCVMDGSRVDTYLNGKLTVNGGRQQVNLAALDAIGYVYLASASYSVAIVPTGQTIDKAMLGPLDVTVAAGHRYTVVMLGQADEQQHAPLVIDETTAFQKARVSPSAFGHITVNNVKNSTSVSFIQNKAGEKDVPYGGFAASALPTGMFQDFRVIVRGATKPVTEDNGPGFNIPGISWLDCFAGKYPNEHDTHTATTTSLLNAVDFLQVSSDGFAKVGHPEWGFATFLAALKTAGMTDQLAQGGPYLLFAPTDEAFAALPKDKRDALLADQKASAELIRAHLVEGYFPPGTLASAPGQEGFDRTVTNMRGEQLKLAGDDGDFMVNDRILGQVSLSMVANGTRVVSVPKLVLPDTK
jgi:uncharacterized surface protein with fasciclin (FAS1) repeats